MNTNTGELYRGREKFFEEVAHSPLRDLHELQAQYEGELKALEAAERGETVVPVSEQVAHTVRLGQREQERRKRRRKAQRSARRRNR